MVGQRVDRGAKPDFLLHFLPRECPDSQADSRKVVSEEGAQIVDSMESQKQKIAQTVTLKTKNNDHSIVATEDRSAQVLSDSERSEEEEVNVTPSGCTLSSLSSRMQETASRVKNMFVFDNKFTVIPACVQNFKNLRQLKFFSNEVTTLPREVGELTQLEQLFLNICPAGLGSLPPLEKLRSLKALELHQKPARPSASTLSREIAQLHSLTRLSVCNFSISWLPPEIGALKLLEDLDISFNKLKLLPKELAGLTSLKTLRVASNKLIELPSELTRLPDLTTIDVAHNRLTSLDSLQLESMTSLRALNAQFNKLQNTGSIPDWIACNFEGNDRLGFHKIKPDESAKTEKDEYLLDWEPSPAEEDFQNVRDNDPSFTLSPYAGKLSSPALKGQISARSRRGWKKQDSQQQKARQDRLNSSRKHRSEEHGDLPEVATSEISTDSLEVTPCRGKDNELEEKEICSPADEERGLVPQLVRQNEDAQDSNKEVNIDDEVDQRDDNGGADEESYRDAQPEGLSSAAVSGEQVPSTRLSSDEKNNCRKAVTGHRPKDDQELDNLVDYHEEVPEEACSKTPDSFLPVSGVKVGRRQDSDKDRNPKPCKRRKSLLEFSEVSFKYCTESFCGYDDRLHDGFYDAGRDRPFSSLTALEKEEPCYDSREVILVDREKDEDLDVTALKAQQLLAQFEPSGDGDQKVNVLRRIAVLALFVSDSFGGSDKTQNISSTRRAALGGTAGMPFVCSCSSSGNGNPARKLTERSTSGAVLPSVHMLCESAVRFLKAQRGSNVLPIGSLSYGVCRHRAILLKYLCDRAVPIIPCELVRGYLDYMPHAWNIVLVETSVGPTRMLVDACRPSDIRPEKDAEYFCRYIPLRRIHLPPSSKGGSKTHGSESSLIPVLHEDIGHGASGALVRRCSFGSLTAAAKVRQLEAVAEGPGVIGRGLESSCLSELRMLCSLQPHPCIVTFYGHQLTSGFSTSPDEAAAQAPQLMLFMEYVKGGSLEGYLQGLARKVPLQSSSSHTCHLAHRGVPPADVCVGTPRWIAPEVLRAMYGRHSYGLEADVWSFGCLLAELLTLDVPYAGLSEAEVHSRIQMGQRPQLPSEVDKFKSPASARGCCKERVAQDNNDDCKALSILVKLFYSCTEARPSGRPTAEEVLTILNNALEEKTASCTVAVVASLAKPAPRQDDTREAAVDVTNHSLSSSKDEESPRVKQESAATACSLPNKSCTCAKCGESRVD
ncbi:hypothetical protein R1flu_019178 [Riccia fluitans]|uniref:Protein kinase domain-containing protein n=1 Tax=Riccia fluitans TaxID=41844 RepID=A0ABD1ZJF0_9MARC